MSAMIAVYADWEGLRTPQRLGWLHARRTRNNEKFEYECDPAALQDPALTNVQIDPGIGAFAGAQYPAQALGLSQREQDYMAPAFAAR